MRIAVITAIITIISWSALTVVKLWGGVMSTDLYWKISFTMAVIGGGIVLSALIVKEYQSEKQLKKDKFVD